MMPIPFSRFCIATNISTAIITDWSSIITSGKKCDCFQRCLASVSHPVQRPWKKGN
jgi:hypothetical protein